MTTPAPSAPQRTSGRAAGFPSPGPAAHLKNRVGRPRGIPMPPSHSKRTSEMFKRLWADPAWRAMMLEKLKVNQPKATAASVKVRRRKPEDPKQRRLYEKLRAAGIPLEIRMVECRK